MDKTIDKRGRLNEEVFTYRISKDNKVFISWHNKLVTTISGSKAQRFIEDIDGADDKEAQLIMAKATGNFKHGNEKLNKRKR